MSDTQKKPRLLILHGLSGSGKTTAGNQLVQQLGAILLRADVERKRLFGLKSLDRSQQEGKSIYTREATEKTFQYLLEKASLLLSQNDTVIIDSAFLKKNERDMFRRLAEISSASFVIVKCLASQEILKQRITERLNSGTDASEATVDILKQQKDWEEPLTAAELERAIVLKTDQADWKKQLFFALPSII